MVWGICDEIMTGEGFPVLTADSKDMKGLSGEAFVKDLSKICHIATIVRARVA